MVARIVAPSGKAQTVQFTSFGDEWGAFMGEFESTEPGQHKVTLSCRETGAALKASFFVQGDVKEPVGRPARPEVLEEIAQVTRGKVIGLERVDEIVAQLRNLPDPAPMVRRVQIWAHPATAAVVVSLCGVFWVARKAVGLI